jgi:Domain of unknown function (DUF4203)
MPLFNILAGAALLLLGRRLFWLFVAGVGFVVGAMLATEGLGQHSEGMTLLLALSIGIIGAILSIFLQKLIVALAGFLAGGYVGYTLMSGLNQPSLPWIAFLVGGVLGGILVLVLFDWALIVLSSLTGAAVIAQNLPLDRTIAALLFIVLLVFGIVVQARQLRPPAPSAK